MEFNFWRFVFQLNSGRFFRFSMSASTGFDSITKIGGDNGGGGDFFVIETERWSFDSFDELIELFNKFKEKHEKIKEESL